MKRIYRHLIHEHNVEKDRRAFDENAAQVRRLLNRDSKTYESLLKSDFAEDTDKVKNATENGGDSAELGSGLKIAHRVPISCVDLQHAWSTGIHYVLLQDAALHLLESNINEKNKS